MKTVANRKSSVCLMLFALLAASVWVEGQTPPYVILMDGRPIEGTSIRATRTGDIILSSDRGDLTFTRDQYRVARAARPSEIDQGRRHMQAGRYDEAIAVLEPIVPRMRHLSWDIEALKMIGAAQVSKEDYPTAITTFDRLFQIAPEHREESDARWPYFRALMGVGQLDRLEGFLNDIIASGDREDAARAQLMRGDIMLQRELPAEAVLDFLRTTILFSAVREVQPEALFKAGLAMRELRHDRARETLRRVIDEHPNSPYAERARELL